MVLIDNGERYDILAATCAKHIEEQKKASQRNPKTNKLKAFRKKHGLTQKQVAEKLIYSVSEISRFENSDKSWGSKINRRVLAKLEEWAKELAK